MEKLKDYQFWSKISRTFSIAIIPCALVGGFAAALTMNPWFLMIPATPFLVSSVALIIIQWTD